MFEFIARLVLVAASVGALAAFRPDAWVLSAQIGAGYLAWAAFLMLLERREFRGVGVSTVTSLLDAGLVATSVAALGGTTWAGVVSFVPLAYGVRVRAVNPGVAGPLGFAIIFASHLYLTSAPISLSLAVQAIAGLGMVYLASPTGPSAVSNPDVVNSAEVEHDSMAASSSIEAEELKESFRRLQEHARSSDERNRRARWAMQLFEAVYDQSGAAMTNLALALREITGASGLTLYAAHSSPRSLIVQAAAGDVPGAVRTQRLPIGKELGQRTTTERSVHQFDESPNTSHVATIPLRFHLRMVGMIWLTSESDTITEEACRRAQECADFVAAMLDREAESAHMKVRLAEAEVLHRVSSTALGAETPRTLLARVIAELAPALTADHLSAHVLDDEDTLVVASEGVPMRWIDAMSFAKGPGMTGWLGIGAPALILTDTHADARCRKEEAQKRRIGCYCFVPILVNGQTYGALAAGSSRVGGVTDTVIETLKLVAGELGQAIERLQQNLIVPCGMVTAEELQAALKTEIGALIVLDPLRKEEFRREYGAEALELCIRKYAATLRASAPQGAMVCRRASDLVVFVPNLEEAFARKWANEAVATASMTSFRGTEGNRFLPFAVRAKVSAYRPEEIRPENDDEITSSVSFPA